MSSRRPRRLRVITLTFVALAVAIVSATALPVYAAWQRAAVALPEVKIESTRHDFGEVFVGEDISHVFTVRNFGPAPLELSTTQQFITPRPASALRSSALRHQPALELLSASAWRSAAPS